MATTQSLVTADGRNRTFIVHAPSTHPIPSPLLLAFHGGYGSAAEFETASGFDAYADAKGFIVCYPQGINRHWNDGRGTVNPSIDDVAFVRQLVGMLRTQLPIDPSRIFAAGMSDGGMFAQRLGVEASDLISAIAFVCANMPTPIYNEQCGRAVDALGIFGDSDPIMPPGGGAVNSPDGGIVVSVTDTMDGWRQVNGCDQRLSQNATANGVRFSRYAGDVPTEWYVVDGMGHCWPPRPAQPGCGPTSHAIDASKIVAEFFFD